MKRKCNEIHFERKRKIKDLILSCNVHYLHLFSFSVFPAKFPCEYFSLFLLGGLNEFLIKVLVHSDLYISLFKIDR